MVNRRLFVFGAGESGPWRIRKILPVSGESLPPGKRLEIFSEMPEPHSPRAWSLQGITSNERYVERREKEKLVESSPAIGRSEATLAALIPIKKNAAWWALTQGERRQIFEEQSHHIKIGLKYAGQIARRLHHCRDLGENEPFDFLTWFEFAPEQESNFDEMLRELRSSKEWTFVEREVEVRLERDGT